MPEIIPDTPSIQHLRNLGVEFRVFVHQGPVKSLEQAASERGLRPDHIVRSILFRLSTDEYVMVLMPGPRQISWKGLRRYFKTNRLTLADEPEVLRVTGFELGAVNPFGLPHPIRILVDEALLKLDEVSLGSGIRGTGLILKTQFLLSALSSYEVINFDPES